MGARAKVRAYEKHCLAYAMVLVKMRTDNALPAEVKSALRLAVENGIAYGQACAAFELDPAAHPQPDASRFAPLIEVSELQKVAWQILPGDGLDLGKMYLGPLKNHIKPARL